MAAASAGLSIMVIISKVAKMLSVPFHLLMGSVCLMQAVVFLVAALLHGKFSALEFKACKWVWLRGFFGCSTYVLYLSAIASGTSLGDVSALTSINVVVAAFLGRAFLGESLRWVHAAAVVLSVTGAALISKPTSLFNQTLDSGIQQWLGFGLALGSGMASGGVFIAARKSQKVSPLIMTFSVSLQEGAALVLLSLLGFFAEPSLQEVLEAVPLTVLCIFAALFLASAFGSFAMSYGAQLCPAAASSTIFTSVGMTMGYTAQSLMQQEPPELLTLSGAALMLLAVMLMASAKQQSPGSSTAPSQSMDSSINTNETESSAPPSQDGTVDSDGAESLASFIATEFSWESMKSQNPRQRHGPLVASSLPQMLGASA